MADILAGQRLRALHFPPVREVYDDTTASNGAAGNWFSGSPGVATTFVAPLSGRVLITVACEIDKGSPAITAAGTMLVSYRMHQGVDSSGVQVQAETLHANTARSDIYTTTPDWVTVGPETDRKTGLTPGLQYWVEWRGQQLVGAGNSMRHRARKLAVIPLQ